MRFFMPWIIIIAKNGMHLMLLIEFCLLPLFREHRKGISVLRRTSPHRTI